MSTITELPRRIARLALRTGVGRRWWERIREALRIRTLQRYLRRLKREGMRGEVDFELLRAIRRTWGDEGWAADVGFLAELVKRAAGGTGPFLECGSGLTTLIAGTLAEARGTRLYSLEQDEEWSHQVATILAKLPLEGVTLWHTPLIAQNDFVWFDLRGRKLPSWFSAVFCDGPAVSKSRWSEEQTLNWRSGIVPVLRALGIEFGEILLDDMDDPRAERLVARWQAEGLRTTVVPTPTGPFLIATPIAVS